MHTLRALTFSLLGLALAGCTSVQKWSNDDPFEGFNRKMFWINQKLDRNAALPAAVFYRSSVPGDFRDGLHNVLTNVGMPITFANDVLQGEFHRAGKAAARFGINTTIGILGVNDPRDRNGLPAATGRFRTDARRLWRSGRALCRVAAARLGASARLVRPHLCRSLFQSAELFRLQRPVLCLARRAHLLHGRRARAGDRRSGGYRAQFGRLLRRHAGHLYQAPAGPGSTTGTPRSIDPLAN